MSGFMVGKRFGESRDLFHTWKVFERNNFEGRVLEKNKDLKKLVIYRSNKNFLLQQKENKHIKRKIEKSMKREKYHEKKTFH